MLPYEGQSVRRLYVQIISIIRQMSLFSKELSSDKFKRVFFDNISRLINLKEYYFRRLINRKNTLLKRGVV